MDFLKKETLKHAGIMFSKDIHLGTN